VLLIKNVKNRNYFEKLWIFRLPVELAHHARQIQRLWLGILFLRGDAVMCERYFTRKVVLQCFENENGNGAVHR
jgi:hypothetical protein